MLKKLTDKKGFTLMEMLVVVVPLTPSIRSRPSTVIRLLSGMMQALRPT